MNIKIIHLNCRHTLYHYKKNASKKVHLKISLLENKTSPGATNWNTRPVRTTASSLGIVLATTYGITAMFWRPGERERWKQSIITVQACVTSCHVSTYRGTGVRFAPASALKQQSHFINVDCWLHTVEHYNQKNCYTLRLVVDELLENVKLSPDENLNHPCLPVFQIGSNLNHPGPTETEPGFALNSCARLMTRMTHVGIIHMTSANTLWRCPWLGSSSQYQSSSTLFVWTKTFSIETCFVKQMYCQLPSWSWFQFLLMFFRPANC